MLWINPIAYRSPFLTSSSRKSAWKKIFDKIKTHWKIIRRVKAGYWVWVPFYLPAFNSFFSIINRILFRVQFLMIRVLLIIPTGRSLLWSAPTPTSTYLPMSKFRTVVYEAHDLMSDFRTYSESLSSKLKEIEKEICAESDLILAPTERILKKLEKIAPGSDVLLFPHGVDYNHFSDGEVLSNGIRKIREKGLPVAGYFGSLSDANDKGVFKILAENGFSVVLIGKVIGDYSDLEQLPNVHIIGPVDYSELPGWAQGFDVGLLNWRMHEWIKNCFPVKSLEYLAAGIPVVSCPIPVLQNNYSKVIRFASTPEEFLRECIEAIGSDSEQQIRLRQKAVQNETWESRYLKVKEYLNVLHI